MKKHEEHICRFNDGEQVCDCFEEGILFERERIRLIVAEYSRISAEATKDIIKLIKNNE
jgi:hypothetical protein